MNTLLKVEQLAISVGCYLATLQLGYPWWLFFALLLLPDLSMVGYAISDRFGAIVYNFFHHQGVALLLLAIGWYGSLSYLTLTGLILFGHSAMDRALGYGLKYATGFQDTHLGKIGKANG